MAGGAVKEVLRGVDYKTLLFFIGLFISVAGLEQTGVLKRFETDLAMSIGKAVSSGFSPQMEQMTSRLEKAIADLSDRMSSMNEDALRTMMQDFSQAISANTADEMKQFT